MAGISLDKSIVQLPARHRMGIMGFAAFSRANDLGAGLVVYPVLGIAAALLTILAGVTAFLQGAPSVRVWPLYVSVFLAVLHSLATARAAPNMLSLRQPVEAESVIAAALDRFARWHNLRAVLQLLNFLMLVWAAVTYLPVLR